METGPLTVLEAMAAGRPVIGSRLGGIAELVVEGKTGLLFTLGQVDELQQKIVELLSEPYKAQQLGLAGRHRAETEFTLANFRERILRLYGGEKLQEEIV
jgi:glycosyltransferase involved in cell wall biosynthesis